MTHKHLGVKTSTGSLRSHPIRRVHKEQKVRNYHNQSLSRYEQKYSQGDIRDKSSKKNYDIIPEQKTVQCPIDKDDYVLIDLTKIKRKGVRVKFTRRESGKKRTVGVEINKN